MSELMRQEVGFQDRLMQRAAVCGLTAVAAFGAHAPEAQAGDVITASDPVEQAIIAQSLGIAKREWQASQPALYAADPCRDQLNIRVQSKADMIAQANAAGIQTDYDDGRTVEGLAEVAPVCRISLNEELFKVGPVTKRRIILPTMACIALKHEVGHTLGLEHNETNKKDVMTPSANDQNFKYMSNGCSALNTGVSLTPKEQLVAIYDQYDANIVGCRTDKLHPKRVHKSYYCTIRNPVHETGRKTYERITLKTNMPFEASGQMNDNSYDNYTVGKKEYKQNITRGAKALK